MCMHLTNTMTINMFIHCLINNVVELAKKTKTRNLQFEKVPYHLFKLYNVSMIYK
jgi:hypothetical protein